MVERRWPESTIVCVASGPSLTADDVDYCRGKAVVLVIKDNVRRAPWADVLYACDGRWWRTYGPSLTFAGLRYSLDPQAERWATILMDTGDRGLEMDPTGLRTGHNSGYQAIGVAVHLGARRIVLLGYDMQPTGREDHWFGPHPWRTRTNYPMFLPMFSTLVQPLRDLGVTIVNATRRTALSCFPVQSLEEALR